MTDRDMLQMLLTLGNYFLSIPLGDKANNDALLQFREAIDTAQWYLDTNDTGRSNFAKVLKALREFLPQWEPTLMDDWFRMACPICGGHGLNGKRLGRNGYMIFRCEGGCPVRGIGDGRNGK